MNECYESLMKMQDAIGSLRETGKALLAELNAGQEASGRLRKLGGELLAGLEALRGDLWKLICKDAAAEELARQAAEDPPAPANTTRRWDNKTGSFTEPDVAYTGANGQMEMFAAGGWHDESF